MNPIVFIGTATITNDGGGGVNCDFTTPAGAQEGDELTACITVYDDLGVVINAPPGWTLLPNSRIDHPSGGDDDLTSVIYKFRAPGPPDPTYPFSITPGTFGTGFDIVGYCARSVASFDTGTGQPVTNSGTGGVTIDVGPIATTQQTETVVVFFSVDELPILTPPTGYTILFQGASPSGFAHYGLYEIFQPVAGSSGVATATPAGGFTDWTGIMFAMIPLSNGNVIFDSTNF